MWNKHFFSQILGRVAMPSGRDGSYVHAAGEARPPLISKQNGTDSKDIEVGKRSGSMTSAKPSELDEPVSIRFP